MSFAWTDKQTEALELLGKGGTHTMLAGGSRSGKTFVLLSSIVSRALRAPGSKHAVLRFRFGHCKQSIVHETFPAMMTRVFPACTYELNKSMWYATINGTSEIWFGGLDDKQRVEKILGNEYATIMLNECSQIPYASRNMAITRLAQLVTDKTTGKPLPLRMYYDENPPDKGHWTYKLFKLHQDPESRQQVDPAQYQFMQLNPRDNTKNIAAEYLAILEALSPRLRKRFLDGEFRDASPNALFSEEVVERWRVIDETLPDMLRVVVAVDPSGAGDEDNVDNDEIGIVVCGLGVDGNGYVLEDLTCKAGPGVWGKVATNAFERNMADRIVAETNYGGAMVQAVIRTARPRTPFRAVNATRGKVVRAEPISALMEAGKVRMAGVFRDLEDELTSFTTNGYMGERSPNRADAFIWACSDLFPELCKDPTPKDEPKPVIIQRRGPTDWMRS